MVDVDLSHPPFSLLDDVGRERVSRHLDLVYFDHDDIILDAGQAGESVYLIHKGEVAELDVCQPEELERIGHYTVGDLFGALSILHGHSRYRFRAEQQTLCYLLPRAEFLALCDDYPAFAESFRRNLAHKTQLLAAQRAAGGGSVAGAMLERVRECMRRPYRLASTATITEAVTTLEARHVDSLLVDGPCNVGIVTKTDLLNALVLEKWPQDAPVLSIANFALVTVRPDQYLFEALVAMTRHRVARVVVMQDAAPVGVVELTDALSHFSSRSHLLSLEMEQADDLASLSAVSRQMPDLVRGLMAQGARPRFVMGLMAALNGRIIAKAWDFTVDERYHSASCLMVMGSEGRGEQILKTDQDNGLIIEDGQHWPQRQACMNAFSDALIRLGYPPCPGDIMVSNPYWVAGETQWRERIDNWAQRGDADALMNLAILLDAHAVAGNPALLTRLREALFERCAGDEILLSYLARPVLRFSTPLTLFGSLKKPQHGIDVKKGGIFPIVHGVRVMALERNITVTSTLERLEALVADGRLEARFAEDLGEALSLFTELRLKQQLESHDGQSREADRVVVQELSSLERDLLREALHIVKDFKQRLSHRYHLAYS